MKASEEGRREEIHFCCGNHCCSCHEHILGPGLALHMSTCSLGGSSSYLGVTLVINACPGCVGVTVSAFEGQFSFFLLQFALTCYLKVTLFSLWRFSFFFFLSCGQINVVMKRSAASEMPLVYNEM